MLVQSAKAVALLASFVAAQTQTNTTVNIGAIDIRTKSAWCQAQINSCGFLCSGRTVPGQNTCKEETLVYQCNCANNKSAPALQYYQNTIPTFLCEQTFADCNANNVGNKAGQDACAEDRAANCGTLNPENYTSGAATTTISSATQSSTSAAGGSSSNVASTVSTTSSKGIAMPTMAATFGSGVVAAGMAAAFGLLL